MIYQEVFARLNPATRFLFAPSGNKSFCPCGIEASFQDVTERKSIALCEPSKSSIYEVPSLLIARGCPGIKWANSPVNDIVDFCVVEITGRRSTNLVKNGTSARKARSRPIILFLNGSLPISTFCVTGRSIMRIQVPPRFSLSLNR